jgi:hypothetical protein
MRNRKETIDLFNSISRDGEVICPISNAVGLF